MEAKFKPFTTSLMGSMPRSHKLIAANEQVKNNELARDIYQEMVQKETQAVIDIQEKNDIDVIVHGELTRDNFMSFVATKVKGIDLLSMSDIAELTNNQGDFEKSLANMDAADNSMNNPVAAGRILTDVPLDYEEMERLQRQTNKPIKATIPSPYMLTRSMWLEQVTSKYYKNRQELGKDVVQLVVNEVKKLIELGIDMIQIDEPILSDIVFNREDSENSFY